MPREETIVTAGAGHGLVEIGALWRRRELLLALVRRSLAARYKQTILGIAWAILQPLLMAAVFTFLFGTIARFTAPAGLPYELFALSGVVVWQYVTRTVADGSQCLLINQGLIGKVYFPRLLLPAAAIGDALVDLACAWLVLLAIMLGKGVWPGPAILAAPLVVVVMVLVVAGPVLALSALTVLWRDIRFAVPFLLQIAMFAAPVVYPLEILPAAWRDWVALNPMTTVIELFRATMLGTPWPSPVQILTTLTIALVSTALGWLAFRKVERVLADHL